MRIIEQPKPFLPRLLPPSLRMAANWSTLPTQSLPSFTSGIIPSVGLLTENELMVTRKEVGSIEKGEGIRGYKYPVIK